MSGRGGRAGIGRQFRLKFRVDSNHQMKKKRLIISQLHYFERGSVSETTAHFPVAD